MPYTITERDDDGTHHWCVAAANCRLGDAGDAVIASTVALVRRSYGENEVLADAGDVLESEIAAGFFETVHLLAAIREGLPDPATEGSKKPWLTTYRSQSAELVAKAALAKAYAVEYPAAPQEGATNANQPILGFDGWGLIRRTDGTYALVLIQVKGTDEPVCPPREAAILAEECRQIPRDRSKICRALTVLCRHLRGNTLQAVVLRMLALMGSGVLPEMHVAPAIVRGLYPGQMRDIQPVRDVSDDFDPATARGIVVTINASLDRFGETVMRRAREPT